MPTTRESLEAALAADPENVALHSAYADLLIEEGDPRGEYIRLELILEDDGLTEGERKESMRRAKEILHAHKRKWLGPILKDNVKVSWIRGWIDALIISHVRESDIVKILRCPTIRLLRFVHLHSGRLYSEHIIRNLAPIPFRNLRLDHFQRFGDRLIELLLENNVVDRLESLALNDCSITDEGAICLSGSSQIHKLKSLSLEYNFLTPIGVAALAEVGFVVGKQRDNPGWNADAD